MCISFIDLLLVTFVLVDDWYLTLFPKLLDQSHYNGF